MAEIIDGRAVADEVVQTVKRLTGELVDARAINPWLVQMFEVAFSRRMCCSRAVRVST